jgi:hypothetical protein
VLGWWLRARLCLEEYLGSASKLLGCMYVYGVFDGRVGAARYMQDVVDWEGGAEQVPENVVCGLSGRRGGAGGSCKATASYCWPSHTSEHAMDARQLHVVLR